MLDDSYIQTGKTGRAHGKGLIRADGLLARGPGLHAYTPVDHKHHTRVGSDGPSGLAAVRRVNTGIYEIIKVSSVLGV